MGAAHTFCSDYQPPHTTDDLESALPEADVDLGRLDPDMDLKENFVRVGDDR